MKQTFKNKTSLFKSYKLLVLAIFMMLFEHSKAQFGVPGNQFTLSITSLDTCGRSTGSITATGPQFGNNISNIVATHIATGNIFTFNPSNLYLFDNLPAGLYSVTAHSFDPNEPPFSDNITVASTNTSFTNNVVTGCGSVVFNGATYTQNTTVNTVVQNGTCTDNITTSIVIIQPPTLQLNSTKNVFGCKDSSLLTITGTNLSNITNVNWLRNGTVLNAGFSNTVTVTAGGNNIGSALNQFSTSLGLAFDALGNMYVGDWNNHRVLKFPPNSNGTTNGVVVAGGNGNGSNLDQLSRVAGICVRGNFLYVCDYDNKRVMKYDISPAATYTGAGVIAAKSGLDVVNEVFVTASGELFVSEHLMGRVSRFPVNSDELSTGTVVAGFGVGNATATGIQNIGASTSQLNNPVGIYVTSNGNLYIADRHNHRIVMWTPGATAGVVVAGGNGQGNALNQFSHPVDVTFDVVGNMFVSEANGARVMFFPPNSNSTTNGTEYANSATLALNMGHIDFDENGNLNMADGGNHRVIQLNQIAQRWVYQPGTYTATVTTIQGCTVNVGPINITSNVVASRDTFNEVGCESYDWSGIVYTNSTTVFDTIKFVGTNCDSLYRVVNITIHSRTYSTTNVQLCPNQFPYTWNGNNYTTTGSYNFTLAGANSNGCDSIATLVITAKNNCCVNTTSTTNVSVCASALPYTWNGLVFNAAGSQTKHITKADGCDSATTLKLNVNSWTDKYDTIRYTGCDSIANGGKWIRQNDTSITTKPTVNTTTCERFYTVKIYIINHGPSISITNSNPCANPQILTVNGVPANTFVSWSLNGTTLSPNSITELLGPNTNTVIEPVLLCRDNAGNIFIPESGRHRIVRVDAVTGARTVVAGTGTLGTGLDQLREPCAVTLDGNDMIITDHWNHRIMRWTIGATSGTVIAGTTNVNGAGANLLHFPLNAVVHTNGNLYVTDRTNHRVMMYTPGNLNGTAIMTGLNNPHDIDFINNNEFLITNRTAGNILRYNLTTQVTTTEYTGLSQPYAMYVHTNGDRYFTQVGNNTVTKVDNGTTTQNVILNNTVLNYPAGITLSNNGCPIVSDYVNARVIQVCINNNTYTVTQNGTYTATVVGSNGCTSTATINVTIPTFVKDTVTRTSCGRFTLNGVTYFSSQIVCGVIEKDINGCDSAQHCTNIIITPYSVTRDTTYFNGCGEVLYKGKKYTSNASFRDTTISEQKCTMHIHLDSIIVTPWTTVKDTLRLTGCDSVQYNNTWYRSNDIVRNTTMQTNGCIQRDSVIIITVNTTPMVTINNSGKCDANQILTIGGAGLGSVASVTWTYNGTTITNARRGWSGMGILVAGATNTSGAATNRLNDPHGVFVVGDDMYISDWGNNRILRWTVGNPNGTAIITGVNRPSNAHINNNLDVFVTEYNDGEITRWNASNNYATSTQVIGSLNFPRGMFVDANARVIVADAGNNRITSRENGVSTNILTTAGTNIANIFGNGNNVYYASQGNNSIRTFTYNSVGTVGARSDLFTQATTGTNLSAPWGLHVQGNNLYVTENGAHRLVCYNLNNTAAGGTVLAGNGTSGTALNRFNVPNGVFGDARGRVFVADGNNHRVLMFDSSYEVTATQSGTYTATITFANGCTRTVTTTVTIPPAVVTQNIKLDSCFSVTLNGVTHITNKMLRDTFRTANGCDSLIRNTEIVIRPYTVIRDTSMNFACGTYVRNGISYTQNTYFTSGSIDDRTACTRTYSVLFVEIKPWVTRYDTITKTGCDTLMYKGIVYNGNKTFNDTIVETYYDSKSPCRRLIRTVNLIIRKGEECACYTNSINLGTGLNANFAIKNETEYDDNWMITNGPATYSTLYPQATLVTNNTIWGNVLSNTKWITQTPSQLVERGSPSPYVFTRTICIDKAMVYKLDVEVLADDTCGVLLDGVLLANNLSTNTGGNWINANKIIISINKYLTVGTHTLQVSLINLGDVAYPKSHSGINVKGTISTLDGTSFLKHTRCCNERGSIAGYKFKDNNFNGQANLETLNPIDSLMSGFTIQLVNSLGNVVSSAHTNNYGQYTFGSIIPGTYTVREIQQPGYVQSFPSNNAVHTITVTAGTVQRANFGNAKPATAKETRTGCNPFTFMNRLFTASSNFMDTTYNAFGVATLITNYNIVVTNPATASATISASQTTICNNGTSTLSATTTNAGNTPTYQWFKNGVVIPGATNSTLVVTNASNGASAVYYCSIGVDPLFTCVNKPSAQSNSITITTSKSNVSPTIAIAYRRLNLNNTVCSGTSVTFNASVTHPGTAPQYQWYLNNVAIPGANASIYTTNTLINGDQIQCTLQSNANCAMLIITNSNVITMNVLAATPITSINGPTTLCVGQTAQYTATPSGGMWSNLGRLTTSTNGLATGTSGGTTSVIYSIPHASGCTTTASINVQVNVLPEVPSIGYANGTPNPQAGATNGRFCTNRTFQLVGLPVNGVWSATGVLSVDPATGIASTSNVVGNGSVTYTFTNANGCSNSRTMTGATMVCKIAKGVSVNEVEGNLKYIIYPNPAKGIVNIKLDNLTGEGKATIIDVMGKQHKQINLSLGINTIDISTLAKGMYLVNIVTKEGSKTEKVIVE